MGSRHLAKVLKCHGFKVQGRAGVDFLTATPPEFDLIVSNPPFSLKDEFLIRAYTLGKPFALLLPLEALFGVKRSPLYMAHGLQLLVPNSASSSSMPMVCPVISTLVGSAGNSCPGT